MIDNQDERLSVLHRTLTAALDIKKHNKLQQFVPYAKQQEFFELGAAKRERMFNAGNQLGKCISYQTLIPHPDGTSTKAGVLYERGICFLVWAWDGKRSWPALATAAIKKPAEPMVRLWVSSGEWVECALNHRVLVDGEWRFVEQCLPNVPCLPATSLGSGLSVLPSSAERWFGKVRDWLGRCLQSSHPGGGRPLPALASGRALPPFVSDARQRTRSSSRSDGASPIHTSSARFGSGHLSSLDADRLPAGQSSEWSTSIGSTTVRRRTSIPQSGLPPRLGLASRLRLRVVTILGRALGVYRAWNSPIAGNHVIAYTPIPSQEVYDFTVPEYGNYVAAGMVHHNSDAGAFETACHVTGAYPSWWTGLRFDKPILAWACGLTADKTMGINQLKLCGKPNTPETLGTGLIPKSCFDTDPVLGRGTTGAFASVAVKHVSGGYSTLAFKSYEQGWQKFQGDGVSFIWLDEEPDDLKVYTECKARLLATGGSMMITFTPLLGETELYQAFARGDDPAKGFVNMTGDDVLAEPHGHLRQEEYDRDINSFPQHEQAARRSGRPIMGSGAIFQISRESIEIPPITEPLGHWRLGWGIDFGGMGGASRKFSHPFAAVLGFYDPITDILYVAHALQLKNMMPIQHADAMKRVCAGAPVFWPHDGHRRTGDDSPETTSGLYRSLGLRMFAQHATFATGGYATETGIMEMQQRFTSGRLKVCTHLLDWWEEFVSYHRDEKGDIVKVHDDLMSATRILVMMAKRFCVGGIPMGAMGGQHWKDYVGKNSQTADGVPMAHGVNDWDIFTGQ